MKTVHNHAVQATKLETNYSTWGEDRGSLTVEAQEIVGNETHLVKLVMTPAQGKDLLRKLRNELINAKVLRGKKQY
jgi:hypothetical protein